MTTASVVPPADPEAELDPEPPLNASQETTAATITTATTIAPISTGRLILRRSEGASSTTSWLVTARALRPAARTLRRRPARRPALRR